MLGRITVSTLGSLFSYGENITLKLDKIDEENTLVTIESSLKVGLRNLPPLTDTLKILI